jgi:hypothetical protein
MKVQKFKIPLHFLLHARNPIEKNLVTGKKNNSGTVATRKIPKNTYMQPFWNLFLPNRLI